MHSLSKHLSDQLLARTRGDFTSIRMNLFMEKHVLKLIYLLNYSNMYDYPLA